MINRAGSENKHLWFWIGIGAALSTLAGALAWASPLFSYDYSLEELPALPLAAGLVFAGVIYLAVLPLIYKSIDLAPSKQRRLLIIIIAFGAFMRLVLLWSEPALEDDYQRYMWDGAITAHGLNPYAISPLDAKKMPEGSIPRNLVKQSAPVHERINHSYLKTIYPPVTQGAFALAYLLKPWSIVAWRLICLAGEAMTLGLLLLLLREARRSSIWVALYWWNPVVVKELINSAHMEAIVTPLILAAFLFAVRRRVIISTTFLGLAMGAKIWPAMLAPLIWRQALSRPRILAVCVLLLTAMAALWAFPAWLGGIDKNSGFVAYAQRWKTGSALFPQIEALTRWLLSQLDLPVNWAPLSARGVLAGLFGLTVLALAWRPLAPGDDNRALDLMRRGGLAAATLLLLSPSQFPWYTIWLAPFLCFLPSIGLMAITALIPIYYTAFYFIAIDQKEVFRNSIVWFIWLPVWALLLGEVWWRASAWRRWGREDRNSKDIRRGEAASPDATGPPRGRI